ncbi:MAG: retroviral-like aspartic protease family protein [Pseudomonadota bacterium]
MAFSKRWMAMALITLALAIPFAWAAEQQTLRLEPNAAKRPFTQVQINGADAYALFDTGATIALIDQAFFAPDIAAAEPTQHARVLGVGGQLLYRVEPLEQLAVGNRSWSDLSVAVNPHNQFPVRQSILPISIFKEAVIDFDFRNNELHFYDGRPRRLRRVQRSMVRYENRDGLIFIPVKIDGVSGWALIDTGADHTFVNPRFAELAKADLDAVQTERIKGSDLSNNTAAVYKFGSMQFAKSEVNNFRMSVLDTDLFAELGYPDAPMMVMGMDVLYNFRLQIDRKRQHVIFNYPIRPGLSVRMVRR